MPPKDPAPTEDLLQIQIAIELDRGRKVAEIASEFHVPEKKVRNIARNAGLVESKKSTSARKRLSEEEKEVLLGRIEAGEDPEELASGVGIKTSTLLRWCKVKGIEVPRRLEQLSQKERKEIREMLEEYSWKEVAQAYRLSLEALEALKEPAYRKLDSSVLAFLFELFKENPKISDSKVLESASQLGIEVTKEEVESYRKRLRDMKRI
ncbi:MAG: hypothetical protein QF495_02955 [SAR324 cluster bacterium]|nr:hypothetical protein [SAR324 cluster bacterium]